MRTWPGGRPGPRGPGSSQTFPRPGKPHFVTAAPHGLDYHGRMAADEPLTARELEEAFPDATIEVPVRAAYRVGLVLVAVATVLLLLIYVGLILAVAAAVLYHAINDSFILTASGGGLLGKLLRYGGPLTIGGVLLFFLTKPLFAPRPTPPPSL